MVLLTNPLSTKLRARHNRESKRPGRNPGLRCYSPITKHSQLLLGSFSDALHFLAFERFLAANVDLDLLRLGFGFLGKLDLKNPLVIVRLNLLCINRVRQGERSREAAILALD